MRVLGIDPGTLVVGYGVIDSRVDEMSLVCCDAISCSRQSPLEKRLSYLYDRLTEVISAYQPDAVAIEQPFVSRNVRTALAIGKAQAVAILAASQRGIPVYEYSPAQVKGVVADYGASPKEQVQKMVGLQLGMTQPPQSSDAADALAVAICHLREVHLKEMVAEQEERK